ncbi:MAG: transposase family protein [Patescibacteria group bacterium]
MTNKQGLVLQASDSSPGRIHDYKYFRKTTLPKWLEKHPQITGYGDSGYEGVNKDYPKANFKVPIKRTRAKSKLSRSEKIKNTKQRRERVIVEHTFAYLKKFRILSEIFRNAKNRYSAIFKSIAFLVNLRMLERTVSI